MRDQQIDTSGTFAALDAVMGEILGAGAGGPNAPLTLSDMAPFLTGWYEERAIANVGVAMARHLPAMVVTFGREPFSQTVLKTDILQLYPHVQVVDLHLRVRRAIFFISHCPKRTPWPRSPTTSARSNRLTICWS